MFRSYWERAAKVTGERIADLSARPLPPSPEVAEVVPTDDRGRPPPVPPTPTGPEEQLSALAGLITRALESADQLAAATRRRKGTKVASEPDATETRTGMSPAPAEVAEASGVDRGPRRRAVAGRRAHRRRGRRRSADLRAAGTPGGLRHQQLGAHHRRARGPARPHRHRGRRRRPGHVGPGGRLAARAGHPGPRPGRGRHASRPWSNAASRSPTRGRRDAAVVGWSRDFDFAAWPPCPPWPARRAGSSPPTPTRPTRRPEGLLPGSGALLAAVATASGVEPVVAGKPNPPMVDYLREPRPRRRRATRAVMVGDQPGTDGVLAERLGIPFVLVDSGVTAPGTPVDACPVALRAADFVSVVGLALRSGTDATI